MGYSELRAEKFEKGVVYERVRKHPYLGKEMLKPINFYCAAPRARSVEIAGDFTQWQPFPMKRAVDGWWFAQLQLSHGHHQYRFLVDGRPILNPHATGIARDERNGQASLIAVS